MKVMKSLIIRILSVSAICVAFGCTMHEDIRETPGAGLTEICTEYPSFELDTKSGVPSSAISPLFAYPLPQSFEDAVEPVPYENYVGGSYYFAIPDGTQNILFCNIGTSAEKCNVSFPAPDAVLRIESEPDSLVGTDIVFGKVSSFSPDTKYSITLKRAVAKLRISLKVTTDDDTVYNLVSRFDSVSVRIGNIYTSLDITPSLDTVYTGNGGFTAVLNNLSSGCSIDGLMTFPSSVSNPSIILKTKLPGGEIMQFAGQLPDRIRSNRYYDIKLSLAQNNAGVGFALEDIDMEDISVDYTETEFSLIELSSKNLYFDETQNSTREIVVTESRLGTWTAEIPRSTLSSFSVSNRTRNQSATVSYPVISGEKGDTIVVTTLGSNADASEYISGEIVFKANSKNSYPVYMYQSNGQYQSVFYEAKYNHQLQAIGAGVTLYSISSDGTRTAITGGGNAINDFIDGGRFELTGKFLTDISFWGVTLDSIRFEDCGILSRFVLGDYSIYNGKVLDFSGLPALEYLSLSMADYDRNTISILMPDSPEHLKQFYSSSLFFPKLQLADSKSLESVFIYGNEELREIDLRNTPSLKSLEGQGSSSLLEKVDISGSSIETVYFNDKPLLASFKAAGCTALKSFALSGDMSALAELDLSGTSSLRYVSLMNFKSQFDLGNVFTGKTSLDSLYVSAYSQTSTSISGLNLDNCTNLRSLTINSLGSLENLSLNGAQLCSLSVSDCDKLATLELGMTKVEKVEIRGCSMLVNITPDLNTVKDIDISSCINLQGLDLRNSSSVENVRIYNTSLPQISTEVPLLGNNSALRTISLTRVAKSSLDLTSVPALEELRIEACTKITSVDCSGLSNLKYYSNDGAPASQLFGGCSSLDSLAINGGSVLTALDVSGMPALKYLSVRNSRLSELIMDDASGMEYLELSSNPTLEKVYLQEGNRLQHAVLIGNSILSFSDIELNARNSLEKLDIQDCYNSGNTRDTLNLNAYSKLRLLNFRNCRNTDFMDLGGCPSLEHADFTNSRIYNINLDGCSSIRYLDLESTDINTGTINGLFSQLPDRTGVSLGYYCIAYANSISGTLEPDKTLLSGKNWYETNSLTGIDFSNN